MKNILTLLICCCCTLGAFAQNNLRGTVLDDKGGAVYFATVALYSQIDSSIVRAASTEEDGGFELEGFEDGAYYVEASMLGYTKAKMADLVFPAASGKSLKLELASDAQMLQTIEVTAKVPLLEQHSDRLVVNVEENLTNLGGSLIDVMKKVPGMIVVGDKLSMAGQSNMTILINGKTTKYMDVQSLLRDMPGDNIKKVEIIHQPGAEFEASGTGPVINIILKKNSLFGTNGSVRVGLAKGKYWKGNTGLSLNHYQGALNINGSVGVNKNAWFDDLEIIRDVDGDVYSQSNFDPSRPLRVRTSLGLDWDMTERQRIGFSGRYVTSMQENVAENSTIVDFADEEVQDFALQGTNHSDSEWSFFTINPYYTYEFDTTGHKLNFDVNFVSYQSEGLNTLRTTELNEGINLDNQQYSQIGDTRIFTTQLDYTYPFSKALKVQAGAKYSDAMLDNNLGSYTAETSNNWIENLSQSNHFLFDEEVMAAYSKLTFLEGKWNGTLGLRYEHSESKGRSVTLDSTLNRTISKLFPSMSVGRELTDVLGASLAYSYRIERPGYSSLNPFVYYVDTYTYDKGNPTLRPALTHSMKLNLTYEKQPFFNVEYKTSSDAMVEVSEQDDATGEAYTTMVNLKSHKNFSTSLYFPLDFIPHVSGYGGIIASHTAYDSDYLGEQFDRSQWSYTGFLQAEFELPGEINTEITGWYYSGGQEGIMDADWLYGVDIGLSKKVLDGKGKISLGVENLFNRFYEARVDYANMDAFISSKWDAPVVNAQFSYKFGNQHMKERSKHRSSASEEINRATN